MLRRLRLWLAALFPLWVASWVACSTADLRQPGTGAEPDAGGGVQDGSTASEAGTLPDGAPLPDYPAQTTQVRVIVEPSDTGAQMRDAINGAQTSVHMEMYLLTANSVITALKNRKAAGVDVKVVLNQTFPTGQDSNQPAYDELQSAGVEVVWADPQFTFTHSKLIVVDAKEAWIMTMNATFTSPVDNREYLVVDSDPADVAEAEDVFTADFTRVGKAFTGKLVISPINAQQNLVQLIDAARSSVEMEAEALSETQVVDALARAADRGVTVRVVLADRSGTQSQNEAISALKGHGVSLVKLTGASQPYVHAKALVVDGKVGYAGSTNFTFTSLLKNREIGVMIGEPGAVQTMAQTISQDFGNGTAL